MRRRFRLDHALLVWILLMVAGIASTGAAASNDASYGAIEALANARSRPESEEAARRVAGAAAPDLLQLARQAAALGDRDTVLPYFSQEAVRRLSRGALPPSVLLDELTRDGGDPHYRYSLLSVLDESLDSLSVQDRKDFLPAARSQARRGSQRPLELRERAIRTSSRVLAALMTSGDAEAALTDDVGQEWMAFAADPAEDLELRGAAVRSIANVRYRDSAPLLLSLASRPNAGNQGALTRSLCRALARLDLREGIDSVAEILTKTRDSNVFITAAVTLGDFRGQRALRALVENADRFDDRDADLGILQLEEEILELFESDDPGELSLAVMATRAFYSPETVERHKAIMIGLLDRVDDPELIRLILEMLEQRVDRAEAREITSRLPENPAYAEEWSWLEVFGAGSPVSAGPGVPMPSSIAGESAVETASASSGSSYSGNKAAWEYGDVGYRDNNLSGHNLSGWIGHAAIFAGLNSSHTPRSIEVHGLGYDVVEKHDWSKMSGNSTFWGTYSLFDVYLSRSSRRLITDIARTMDGEEVAYTFANALDPKFNPGVLVDEDEVDNFRCDGLIEYSYEKAGFDVWGKNGDNYSIWFVSNVKLHNDLYPGSKGPDEELAPVVQCGEDPEGGTSSNLTWGSTVRYPSLSYSYTFTYNDPDYSVTLSLTGSDDQSGIHRIGFSKDDSSYTWSPTQPQHPTSNSYTWSPVEFTLANSTAVWVPVSDGANNGVMFRPPIDVGYTTLSVPSGGESWAVGSKQTITWTHGGTLTEAEIQYRIDSGSNWLRVVSATPNDDAFQWIVPNDTSSTARVRIRPLGSPDWSESGDFTITGSPQVTVTAPNGGETWSEDTTYNITWDNDTTPVGNVDIDYSVDEGSSWINIATTTAAAGTYPWTVPVGAATTRALIAVSGTLADASDEVFTITDVPPVRVEVPNGGESWEPGKSHFILWSTTDGVGYVRIEYSIANGGTGTWSTEIASTPNTGSYRWEIPDTPSTVCKVRICEAVVASCDLSTIADSSDSVFEIQVAKDVSGVSPGIPGGGTVLVADTIVPIAWQTAGLIDDVWISLSRNGGATWEDVVAKTANDSIYEWTVPGTGFGCIPECVLRVCDEYGPACATGPGFAILGLTVDIPALAPAGLFALAAILTASAVTLSLRRRRRARE